jgi:hypothetical protein
VTLRREHCVYFTGEYQPWWARRSGGISFCHA